LFAGGSLVPATACVFIVLLTFDSADSFHYSY